jgi:hypothetical protein
MEPRGRWGPEPWPAPNPYGLWEVEEILCLRSVKRRWLYWERKVSVDAEIWQLQALEEL